MVIFVKRTKLQKNCNEKTFYVSNSIILIVHFLDGDGGTGD